MSLKHSEILNLKRPATRPSTKPQMLRVRIGEAVVVVTVAILAPKSRAHVRPSDSVSAFVRAWVGGKTIFPRCPCASTDLYAAYLRWCRTSGKRVPVALHQFLGHGAKIKGWSTQPRHVYAAHGSTATRSQRVVIPPAAVLAKSHHKGAASSVRWLTSSSHTFRAALNETVA